MKRTKTLLIITLALSSVMAVFTFFDFLCLHDINNDYISRSALEYLEIGIEEDLPAWTATPGEWRLVTIGYGVRVVSLILTIAALALCLRETLEAGVNA